MDRNVFQDFEAGTSSRSVEDKPSHSEYTEDVSSGSENDSEPEMSDEEDWIPPPDNMSDDEVSEISSSSSSESDSNDKDGESDNDTILSKNGEIAWSTTPFREARPPSRNRITLPLNTIPKTGDVVTPEDAYLLFIDNKLIDIIVKNTNKEGKKMLGKKKKEKDVEQEGEGKERKRKQWTDTDSTEIKAFIGCLIHAGALHENKHSIDILFSPVDGNHLIRAAFSSVRFSQLLCYLRFDDKDTRNHRQARDQFAAFREFWECWHKNLEKYYIPGENITVDEQLIPFRGRCGFLQYMPSKPDKYGMKIFWSCDSKTAFPLRGSPYLGKNKTGPRPAERNVGLGAKTVVELTKGFKGRNVTCDNYFTTLDLANDLHKENMTMVGTVKRNKAFLPKEFQAKKSLALYDSKFVFRKESTLVSYQSKRQKNVILLSTMHNDPETADSEMKKPEIVLKYNETKGGVDTMDFMAHSFTTKRKTKRWPLVQFFNILDLSTICARVIYQTKFPKSELSGADSRQLFIINIARALALPHIQRRQGVPTLQNQVKENIASVLKALSSTEKGKPQPKKASKGKKRKAEDEVEPTKKQQKRCGICPAKRDRKTRTKCSSCSRFICGEHTVVCCVVCANSN